MKIIHSVAGAIAQFPATFGLRSFPGKMFRLSQTSSYISGDTVQLYTEVQNADGTWSSFAKGTIDELRQQLVIEVRQQLIPRNYQSSDYRKQAAEFNRQHPMNNCFAPGSGMYSCTCCGRKTRQTDPEAAQHRQCAECWELAGLQNQILDGGGEDGSAARRVSELKKVIAEKGGSL